MDTEKSSSYILVFHCFLLTSLEIVGQLGQVDLEEKIHNKGMTIKRLMPKSYNFDI